MFLESISIDICYGLNEKRRETHRGTGNKGIQEYTMINSNHMYMRDMIDTITSNSKQKIVFLIEFTRLKSRLIFLCHWFAT